MVSSLVSAESRASIISAHIAIIPTDSETTNIERAFDPFLPSRQIAFITPQLEAVDYPIYLNASAGEVLDAFIDGTIVQANDAT
ncbi:MAG: hypothetical protein E3J35_09630 [Methanomassiliicoccales archaeon]|nr:MAG: hypothetical protein E3J35_09630 [Methanomassiliicoccales archaeon]